MSERFELQHLIIIISRTAKQWLAQHGSIYNCVLCVGIRRQSLPSRSLITGPTLFFDGETVSLVEKHPLSDVAGTALSEK